MSSPSAAGAGDVDTVFSALAVSAAGSPSRDDLPIVNLLLADFLACCLGSRGAGPASVFAADGVMGRVAQLSVRSSARDLDDLDWATAHHPGSVVLPVVVALAGVGPTSPEVIVSAVVAGYRAAATMAEVLGPEHRRRWHVTSTAGGFGAASAACVMLGAEAHEHAGALALTAANIGGIGQAPFERAGAASFNRAAAATLGLLAARAALSGSPWPERALSGDRGLLALTAGPTAHGITGLREGLHAVSPRLYPVTGFAQTSVEAAAGLRDQASGALVSMEVAVPAVAATMADGTVGGDWWHLKRAVLRAWSWGDPFKTDRASADDELLDKVTVHPGDLAPGSAVVNVTTTTSSMTSGLVVPAIFDHQVATIDALQRKWVDVLGQQPTAVLEMASELLATGMSTAASERLLY